MTGMATSGDAIGLRQGSAGTVASFLPVDESGLTVGPALAVIEAHAEEADRTRSINPAVIQAVKATGALRLAATGELAGAPASFAQIGRELEAVAARCTSTAWCLWNHLGVFHLFVGALGPDQAPLLAEMVRRDEWVCFPAGAGSGVYGTLHPGGTDSTGSATLVGKGSFGSGSRYADWAGVVFAVLDAEGQPRRPLDLRFTVVPLDDPAVRVRPTWDGSAVRASATDDIDYDGVAVPLSRCVPWFGANRAETLREVPVVAHRYREDWVGIGDVWLAQMGVGLARAALAEAAASITTRRAIMGRAMVTRPSVQLNLGRAATLIAAARATVDAAAREIDDRVAGERPPTEGDYLRQMAVSTAALDQLAEAMALILRSSGGNGLRESASLERRWRDFQAMPLHINAHVDRVTHQVGRFTLGEELEPF